MRRAIAAAALFAATLAIAHPASSDPLGRTPAYTSRTLSAAPNAEAMTARIWSPDLDQGFVPQGLTVFAGAVYVGAYKSEDRGKSRGPCRLYRIDPLSGAIWGALDLPPACGHAGGLARGKPGRLWVADTQAVFEVALSSGDGAIGAVLRSVRLDGALKGSFAAGTADALWLGTYSKEPGAKLYKIPFDAIGPNVGSLNEQNATEFVLLPEKAQGAAFDGAGRLWITRSGSQFGELAEIDAKTGEVRRRFAMPAGIEDISFDPSGGLWAVSEAGSKRWLGWSTFFPVVFRLDMGRLK
jgi:sugar lactone lactonase YvrE